MKKIYFFLTLSIFIFSNYLFSYPRFSAYNGDKCMDCHISPSGGSMRNQYGINYAKQNLQMEYFEKIGSKTSFNPQLNKSISIGGDVRTLYAKDGIPNQPDMNTFLTMQGDLYVNAALNDYVNVFVAPGIYIPSPYIKTKYEVYGMISKMPLDMYFKVGRFTPNFGIKIVEHRAYQRADLLNTPYSADAGLELGFTPGIFNFNIGVFNGLKTDFFDNDRKKMFVASADFMLSNKNNNINANFGTSFYNNPYDYLNPITLNMDNGISRAFAGFTKIGIFKKVAFLGEVDFGEQLRSGNMTRALYGYGELNFRIVKGIELRTMYEYRDPDRDRSTDRQMRFSAGAAFFPLLGFETEAMIRFINDETAPNTNEIQWNFHFYF